MTHVIYRTMWREDFVIQIAQSLSANNPHPNVSVLLRPKAPRVPFYKRETCDTRQRRDCRVAKERSSQRQHEWQRNRIPFKRKPFMPAP